VAGLQSFSSHVTESAKKELEAATQALWAFYEEESMRLSNDEPRRPSDFLDEASLRMVEGPYDVVVVITDVALVSHRHRIVPGLASPLANVIVISVRRLLLTPRGEPRYNLDDDIIHGNAATLLLHLMGHVLGLGHSRDERDVMSPFWFDATRKTPEGFAEASQAHLTHLVRKRPRRERLRQGSLQTLAFHTVTALRHFGEVLPPLLRNRAPLLPLTLPGLATAAVVPALVLVFSAETWDVGVNMTNTAAFLFTLISVLAATVYLTLVQNLFFPHKEKRVLTEHLALLNVSVFLAMLFAVLGLFVMLAALMLAVQLFIFPADLITAWPTLEDPVVTGVDQVRIASFISAVGVVTGALAGGLESRAAIRHLALFMEEP
jgi:predicted Zn-dependent protease